LPQLHPIQGLLSEKTPALVVGGGPAVSYYESVLARHEMDVTILEDSNTTLGSRSLQDIGPRETVMADEFMK
jgi:NADPH-dependent 2,4-dienoyl-CoA reductase/sulfur reductase-like enzyme